MKMRQFLVCPYPQEVGLAPSWAAGVVRDEKNEKMVPTEAVACMLAATGKEKWKSRLRIEPCREPDCVEVGLEVNRFDDSHRISRRAIAMQLER